MDPLRDLLQPLAMPLLRAYQAVRASAFLNVAHADASRVEALGDLLLAPVRYAFGGRVLRVLSAGADGDAGSPAGADAACEHQAFRYDRAFGATLALSLAVSPGALVLGAVVKGLALVAPGARQRRRERLAAVRASALAHLAAPRDTAYDALGLPPRHGSAAEPGPSGAAPRPTPLTRRQRIELEALRELVAALDAHRIVHWVDCGTCLGVYRHGGFVPWDRDIDVAVLVDDHDRIRAALGGLDPTRYLLHDWSSYAKPKTFLKLLVKATGGFIDLYHYALDAPAGTLAYRFTFSDSPIPAAWKRGELACTRPVAWEVVFPLRRARFDGVPVWVPSDLEAYLHDRYGPDLTPSMRWDPARRAYTRSPGHPWWRRGD